MLAGQACAAEVAQARQVRFGVRSASELGGVEFGAGAVGVVLAHEARANVCNWVPYARELAALGYRALAFDFSGRGASAAADNAVDADVAAAAALLRSEGVRSVVLMGASMGGTAVVGAAATIQPRVAGVVCLSGPQFFQGVRALDAARVLAAPVLYAVGEGDTTFASDADAMYQVTRAGLGTLVKVPSTAHGTRLLDVGVNDDPAAKKVRAEVAAFLYRVARPS